MSHEQSLELEVLLRAVTKARSRLDVTRTQGSSRERVEAEQRRLLAALEAYAAALASHGHPMPYRMRSELAMFRAMFDPTRPRTP